jgi:hypothetical protein
MNRFLNVWFLAVAMFVITACGGDSGNGGGDPDPQPTPEQLQTAKIAGTNSKTWRASSISLNGAPAQNYDTQNFSITFTTSKNYTTTAGDPVFQASGSWNYQTGNLNSLIFDNDQNAVATLSNLNSQGTQMTLTIDFELASAGSRVEAINGTYVFTLVAD